MARTHFFAAPEDQLAFRHYIDSLGLPIYPAQSDALGKWSAKGPDEFGGYITFLAAEQFHPYRNAKDTGLQRSIVYVLDPLILWIPSWFMTCKGENYIIQGWIEYDFSSEDRQEEQRQGAAYFGKLRRWIRKHWPALHKRDFAYGPEALKLVQEKGYLARGIPPDIEMQYIKA